MYLDVKAFTRALMPHFPHTDSMYQPLVPTYAQPYTTNTQAAMLKHKIQAHEKPVLCIAISNDCLHLASGSIDTTIRMWAMDTGQGLYRLSGHTGAVCSVDISKNDAFLVSGDSEGAIFIWQFRKADVAFLLRQLKTERAVKSVRVSPNCLQIASAGDSAKVDVWELATGKALSTFNGHVGEVACSDLLHAAWSPDSQLIASGGHGWRVRVWNAATGIEAMDVLGTMEGHYSGSLYRFISCVVFGAKEPIVVTAGGKNAIVWKIDQGAKAAMVHDLKGHAGTVCSVSLSPDDKFLASSCTHKTVILWNVVTGKQVTKLTEHSKEVQGVAWSSDGQHVASGGRDGAVCVWDVDKVCAFLFFSRFVVCVSVYTCINMMYA
jgi:WD40 repeat protein